MRNNLLLLVLVIANPLQLVSDPLFPQPPVPITVDAFANTVNTPVAVAGSSDGFVAAWSDNSPSRFVMSSFSSDQGQTWSTPILVGSDSSYNTNIAVYGSKAVLAWVNIDPGFNTGEAYVAFSSNSGQTWSRPIPISPPLADPGGTVNPPVAIASNSSGFMAAWTAFNMMSGHDVWVSFSADGQIWSDAKQATPNLLVNPYDYFDIAGNPAGFLITWTHYDSGTSKYRGYSTFSSDLGSSWSSPTVLPDATDLLNSTTPTAFGLNSGFMISWVDSANHPYSSFSTDNGITWSPQSLIAADLSLDNIDLSGNSDGVAAVWHDSDNNLRANFTANHGQTWGDPVSITTDGSVNTAFFNSGSVSVFSTHCMFTWLSADENAMSSYSIFPATIPRTGIRPPTTLYAPIIPNLPKSGLFGR